MPPLVLAIDDNPADVALLREAFAEIGCPVEFVHALSGSEAFALLAARRATQPDRRPALVLCDLELPELTGDRLLAQLRQDPRLAEVPSLLLTGHDAESAAARAGPGATAIRRKPSDFDGYVALAEELRAHLR